MSSYIQIPYGFRKVSNPIQFSVPKNFEENQYLNRIGYISNEDDPAVKNNILDAVKNREDLQKWILATSDFGRELQQDINEITAGDEKFKNAVLRRALDLKSDGLFRNPQSISLLFNDVEKFHQQNPIIGKLATQVNVSKLSERDLVKRRLLEGEISKIEERLHNLKYGKVNKDDDNNDDDNDEPPTPPRDGSSAPPMREAEMDPSFRRTPEPKDPKKEPERDLQKVFRELRYGKVKPREAPPDPFSPTFWNEVFKDPNETVEDKIEQNIIEPREEFDFTKLPSVPTFESESHEKTQDSFSRPITKMLDGETIEITPKAKITEEKQISDTLQQLFPDVEKVTEENKKADVKVDLENLSETLTAIGNEVLPVEFEFFKGGTNEKFSNIIRTFDSGTETLEFLDFLQSKICKKILEDNKLKIHVETGNIYYDNNDTNESIHNFILAESNPISGEIDHTLTFDRDYVTYFQWLTDAFSESKKALSIYDYANAQLKYLPKYSIKKLRKSFLYSNLAVYLDPDTDRRDKNATADADRSDPNLTWRLNNLHDHTFLKNEYRIPIGLITDLGLCNFPVQTDTRVIITLERNLDKLFEDVKKRAAVPTTDPDASIKFWDRPYIDYQEITLTSVWETYLKEILSNENAVRMGVLPNPFQQTFEVATGAQTISVDFQGASRELNWLEISLVYDKSYAHETVYDSYDLELAAHLIEGIKFVNASKAYSLAGKLSYDINNKDEKYQMYKMFVAYICNGAMFAPLTEYKNNPIYKDMTDEYSYRDNEKDDRICIDMRRSKGNKDELENITRDDRG